MIDNKFEIGQLVEVLFSQTKESICDCCDHETTIREKKAYTFGVIKEIRIDKNSIRYAVDNLDQNWKDTTYIIDEEEIKK